MLLIEIEYFKNIIIYISDLFELLWKFLTVYFNNHLL